MVLKLPGPTVAIIFCLIDCSPGRINQHLQGFPCSNQRPCISFISISVRIKAIRGQKSCRTCYSVSLQIVTDTIDGFLSSVWFGRGMLTKGREARRGKVKKLSLYCLVLCASWWLWFVQLIREHPAQPQAMS